MFQSTNDNKKIIAIIILMRKIIDGEILILRNVCESKTANFFNIELLTLFSSRYLIFFRCSMCIYWIELNIELKIQYFFWSWYSNLYLFIRFIIDSNSSFLFENHQGRYFILQNYANSNITLILWNLVDQNVKWDFLRN